MDNPLFRPSSGDKVHSCKFCSKQFEKSSALATHLLMHKRCPHMCSVCRKLFSQKKHFTDHVLSLNGGNALACQTCQTTFPNTNLLIKHLQNEGHSHVPVSSTTASPANKSTEAACRPPLAKIIYVAPKKVLCKLCSFSFYSKSGLREHLKTQHTAEVGGIPDETCSRKSSLVQHLPANVEDGLEHACHLCSQTFLSQTSLTNHLLYYHCEQRAHMCEVCDRAFSRKSTLQNHLLTHTVEKPHVCDICQKACAHKQTLHLHKLLNHSDVGNIALQSHMLSNHSDEGSIALQSHMLGHKKGENVSA